MYIQSHAHLHSSWAGFLQKQREFTARHLQFDTIPDDCNALMGNQVNQIPSDADKPWMLCPSLPDGEMPMDLVNLNEKKFAVTTKDKVFKYDTLRHEWTCLLSTDFADIQIHVVVDQVSGRLFAFGGGKSTAIDIRSGRILKEALVDEEHKMFNYHKLVSIHGTIHKLGAGVRRTQHDYWMWNEVNSCWDPVGDVRIFGDGRERPSSCMHDCEIVVVPSKEILLRIG